MQKVNLCEACSKEKGVEDPKSFALADLLLGIGAAEEIEKGGPSQKCPMCGFSQADFKKTGRLGCSECYVTFAEGLISLLKAMHKGTEHVGKLPERAQRSIALSHRMRALTENLQKAVADENYETAASLRDQIRRLESELSNRHEIFKHAFYCGRMAAWRRAASPSCNQQQGPARAQSAPPSFSWMGEESGPQFDSRTD